MPVWGWVLGILLALVLLVLFAPVRIWARVCSKKEWQVKISWLFIRLDAVKWAKKFQARAARKKQGGAKGSRAAKREEPAGGKKETPESFLEKVQKAATMAQAAAGPLAKLLRSLRLDRIRLEMTVAREDAAQTAIAYGEIYAALHSAYATLAHFLQISRPQVRVRPDFTAEEGWVEFSGRAGIRLASVIAALAEFLWNIVKQQRQQPLQQPPRRKEPQKTAVG